MTNDETASQPGQRDESEPSEQAAGSANPRTVAPERVGIDPAAPGAHVDEDEHAGADVDVPEPNEPA